MEQLNSRTKSIVRGLRQSHCRLNIKSLNRSAHSVDNLILMLVQIQYHFNSYLRQRQEARVFDATNINLKLSTKRDIKYGNSAK
jgi:hypothetical protein